MDSSSIQFETATHKVSIAYSKKINRETKGKHEKTDGTHYAHRSFFKGERLEVLKSVLWEVPLNTAEDKLKPYTSHRVSLKTLALMLAPPPSH